METDMEPAPTANTAKAALRRAALAARKARFGATPGHGVAALRERLTTLVAAVAPKVVAAYMPFGTEPGGADLPEFLALSVPEVIVPVLLPDKDLDWRPYDEPGRHLGVDAIARAQLVIVPAVAVDLAGNRLGRGGGSYDRALARVGPGATIAALLHDGELLAEVPHEPHDRRVDVVLTPSASVKLDR
jgi:5-formyltetrahydrofolate cyclo-ligase